jgi:hypothetical protein
MSARRTITLLLAPLLLIAFSAPLAAASKQAKLNKKYQALVDEADALWAEYKKADKNFFEKGKSDFDKHLAKLADLQDRLAALHTKWMGMETPDAVGTSDFKVGLALELQIAAIGAEIVGLLEDDQDYMNLSTELDKQYEAVVADL